MPVSATQSYIYKWDDREVSVVFQDNYGTTLGEKIRSSEQRDKAYYIFNQLRDSSKKIRLYMNLSGSEILSNINEKNAVHVNTIDIKEVEELTDSVFDEGEKYAPVYDSGKLFYLKWSEDILKLEADGYPIFRSKESFDFFGKKKEDILLRVDGNLTYLSEVDWLPVESLQGYTVGKKYTWINEGEILALVQNEVNGKNFIAVASVRRPDLMLVPAPGGSLLDTRISSNKKHLYCLHFVDGYWQISRYSFNEGSWVIENKFGKRIYLMGISRGRLMWWDEDYGSIFTSDGDVVRDIDHIRLKAYPQGQYLYGQVLDRMVAAAPSEKIVLFYDSRAEVEDRLTKIGLNKKEKYEGETEVWLLPSNYKSDIMALPSGLGNVYFSMEDMRVYYDTTRRGLRIIKSIRLKPTVKERNVLILIALVLFILIMGKLAVKTREYTKK